MEPLKKIKKATTKKNMQKSLYSFRSIIAQAILAAGAIGFIMQNLDKLTKNVAIAIAVGVVGLILYFGNKR